MKTLVDLSHTIKNGMVTYPGLPAPKIGEFLTREAAGDHYADGTTFAIGQIDMVANTGTYVDAPFHRYAGGGDLSQLPLEALADLKGTVFRVESDQTVIGPDLFSHFDLRGRAVLFNTGWARYWGQASYFKGHPHLTAAAAEALVAAQAALVGIDSLNIDRTADGHRPVHSILLKAGIPIVEHLCRLENLPDTGFTFHAVPVKVQQMGSFPVRAYAVVHG